MKNARTKHLTAAIIASLAIALVALALTGCAEKIADKVAEEVAEGIVGAATGADIEIDDDDESVTIETDEGSMSSSVGDSAEIPADFPSDMPICDGDIVSTTSFDNEGGKTISITIETDDSIDDVKAFYEVELVDEGWEQTLAWDSSADGERSVTYGLEKGDSSAQVLIMSDDDKTMVSITVTTMS